MSILENNITKVERAEFAIKVLRLKAQGVETTVCSKFTSCDYVKQKILGKETNLDRAEIYIHDICNKYPHLCILNN